MTLRERILANCGGDEDHAELVMSLLSRERRPEQGRLTPNPAGQQQPPPVDDEQSALPAEQVCPNCLIPADEAGYCNGCGFNLNVRRP